MAVEETSQACVQQLLIRFQQTQFYGKVELVFRQGSLAHIEVKQSLKPEDVESGLASPLILKPDGSNGSSKDVT